MLSVGLTGGIASGKSFAAKRLVELGAVLIDADVVAREVVEPGTMGLAQIQEEFGGSVISPDGRLDRAKLGALIFADTERRHALNAIVHPLVRSRAAEIEAAASTEAIILHDIPLLAETGQGANFHLVVVVDAAQDAQVTRMIQDRGLSREEALSRIHAQASREQRLAVADVVLENNAAPRELLSQVDRLWAIRLLPFEENLRLRRRANRPGPAILSPANPGWATTAERLSARILRAVGEGAIGVDHIGSTSVPGLAAKDVIDLQLRVKSLEIADRLEDPLAQAGFPRVDGIWSDTPKLSDPNPEHWQKRFHGNSDPGRAVNLHVRVDGSAGANYALAFRDWLRSDQAARMDYLHEKERVARLHAGESSTAGYAEGKEPWFSEVAEPRLQEWISQSGWTPEGAIG